MKASFDIHPIQAKALRVLLFQTEAKFCELNIDKVPTDQFNFHLKSLLDAGILEKKTGKYLLTLMGKEFANRFDTEKVVIERQAKLGVAVTAVQIKNGKKYFLVQQRLKQPYYGYYGFITGKIRWGEKVIDTATRELLEETGLISQKITLVGISHKTDYAADKKLLEDKFFFRIRVDKFSGKLIETMPEGKNFWMTKAEILILPKIFPDLEDIIKTYEKNNLAFVEKSYEVEGY